VPKTEVKSSNIKSIDYTVLTQNLTIEFNSGETYSYSNVSPATWAAFLAAPSKGLFFSTNLKNSYKTTREPR
jgi:hypothetical protein